MITIFFPNFLESLEILFKKKKIIERIEIEIKDIFGLRMINKIDRAIIKRIFFKKSKHKFQNKNTLYDCTVREFNNLLDEISGIYLYEKKLL